MSKASKRKRSEASRASAPAAAGPSAATTREAAPRDFSRWEIVMVAAILVGGVVLRVAFPGRMAVEHFDEGVYASNLWFDAEAGGQYPARHLYAPPLVPALIECSLLAEQVAAGSAVRPSGVAAMLPNLLAGCLTLLAVWWVMRTWFEPAAAIGAMALASGSEFHALYTRTALTDVLLLPWMLLAVYWFERALATRHLRPLLLAGLACGLAWWTKYNGWLPLLIGLGGIVLRLVFVPAARRSAGRDLACWAGFAAIAAAVWSPYLWSLQATGGYAPVMANHRGYVVGLAGWLTSFSDQLANLTHFDGWVSCLVPAAALLLVLVYRSRARPCPPAMVGPPARPGILTGAVVAAASIALAAWSGVAVVLSYLAVSGLLAAGLRSRKRATEDAASGSAALWLVAAWLAGLFVMTPLYAPYPRLTLPWLCASWLAGGLGVAALCQSCTRGARTGCGDKSRQLLGARLFAGPALGALLLVISIIATYYAGPRVTSRGLTAWQDRTGLRRAASVIKGKIDVDRAIVFVQGEPGLYYQLRAAGVAAAPGFDFQQLPASLPAGVAAYLATGLHAQRSEDFQRQLARVPDQLEEVAAIPYQPSDLVLLNNFRPRQLAEQQGSAWRIRLYRLP